MGEAGLLEAQQFCLKGSGVTRVQKPAGLCPWGQLSSSVHLLSLLKGQARWSQRSSNALSHASSGSGGECPLQVWAQQHRGADLELLKSSSVLQGNWQIKAESATEMESRTIMEES